MRPTEWSTNRTHQRPSVSVYLVCPIANWYESLIAAVIHIESKRPTAWSGIPMLADEEIARLEQALNTAYA